MRIVGGEWRGRQILAPEGRGTRPTVDRMRESMASMLLSARGLDLGGVCVLDAYAGSGAIGLELLSRGASWCTFVERNRRAAQVVSTNLRNLGVAGERAQLVVGDVAGLTGRGRLAGAPFGIVVLDPPYATPVSALEGLVEGLYAHEQLDADCLVLYEHAAGTSGLALPMLQSLREKTHGSTCVSLYRLHVEGAS